MAQGVLRFRFSMDAGEQTTVSLSLLIFKNHSWQNATDKVLQYLCDYHKLEDDLQRVFTHTMASKNFHRVQRLSTLANDPWYMLSKGNAVETKYIPYTVVNSFFLHSETSVTMREPNLVAIGQIQAGVLWSVNCESPYVSTTIGSGKRDYSSGAHNHKENHNPKFTVPHLQFSTLINQCQCQSWIYIAHNHETSVLRLACIKQILLNYLRPMTCKVLWLVKKILVLDYLVNQLYVGPRN